jgi:hypothetical protein
MSNNEILWFALGWIGAALTPLLVETSRFLALIVKDAGRRREMIYKAKEKVNGRFNGFSKRQDKIKSALKGGTDNGKKE